MWAEKNVIANLNSAQQVAKLCVGVVQDWITFELAIRIRNAKGSSNISEAAKKKLRKTSGVLILILALSFVIFVGMAIVSAHKQGNDGYSFYGNVCSVYKKIGYIFLG